jgi:multiple sugar transport system substrate-binding protein
LAAAGLIVASCGRDDDDDAGGSGGGTAAPVEEGEATGSVSVWAMGTEGENLDTLAAEFEAANPEVDVEVTPVPWDAAHDKIATAIAGGQTPDVSMVGTTWMGEFAATGALDPTPTDLIDSSQFFEGAWNTTIVEDTSYAVPWYVETRVIFYRKDLAEAAGVEPPTNWDELKSFVTALQEQGVEWGIDLHTGGTGAWQTFMPFAWQAGAEIAEDGEFTLGSDAMVEAMEYYQSFFEEGLADPQSDPTSPLEVKMVDEEIGSFISGPWHMGLLREQGGPEFEDKWDVTVMPTEEAGTSFVGGSNLAVFKDAANRDAAWKFVAFLMQPDVQQTWYETVTDLPSVQAGWESGTLAEDPRLATFGQQLEDAKAPPSYPTWEQVASVIDGQIEAVVKGGEDPSAAVEAIQSEATSIGTGTGA